MIVVATLLIAPSAFFSDVVAVEGGGDGDSDVKSVVMVMMMMVLVMAEGQLAMVTLRTSTLLIRNVTYDSSSS